MTSVGIYLIFAFWKNITRKWRHRYRRIGSCSRHLYRRSRYKGVVLGGWGGVSVAETGSNKASIHPCVPTNNSAGVNTIPGSPHTQRGENGGALPVLILVYVPNKIKPVGRGELWPRERTLALFAFRLFLPKTTPSHPFRIHPRTVRAVLRITYVAEFSVRFRELLYCPPTRARPNRRTTRFFPQHPGFLTTNFSTTSLAYRWTFHSSHSFIFKSAFWYVNCQYTAFFRRWTSYRTYFISVAEAVGARLDLYWLKRFVCLPQILYVIHIGQNILAE